MYHIFFIQSSIDGNLGCFLMLAIIVSSAAVNIGVHISFQISASDFFEYPEVDIKFL